MKSKRFLVRVFLFLIIATVLALFFSYRIEKVPPGLTVDEAAFGYNAVLLGETFHDETGRFLPIFVLSIHGSDWRQPITQYFIALFFKIFGPSYFNLRFTSVLVVVASIFLLYFLARRLFDFWGALLATFVFITTPIIMIHSHMALDNIMPVPFVLIWLITLHRSTKPNLGRKKRRVYLIVSAWAMGVCFYTYKAMRAMVPIWSILTIGYFLMRELEKWKFVLDKKRLREFFVDGFVFTAAISPFFLIIPLLEKLYAGAVFDRQHPSLMSVYEFLYPYFSSFDPSFLFIKGDATHYHSTGRHGMMLLASSPLFLIGLYKAVKKNSFWWLIVLSFFGGPLLFGFVNSVHRASRMIALVPFYSLISSLGGVTILRWKRSVGRVVLSLILILMVVNYIDFLRYYYFVYPKVDRQWFSSNTYKSYQMLAVEAKKRKRVPYVEWDVYRGGGESAHFFEVANFRGYILKWFGDRHKLPLNSILLSQRKEIDGFVRLPIKMKYYYLHIPKEGVKNENEEVD